MSGLRHIPRDWRYREVPDWARRPVEGDAYCRYCAWLAHHLRSKDFPLNAAQARYAESLTDKDVQGIAIELGDMLGLLLMDRAGLEECARQDMTYSELEKVEYEGWQEIQAADPENVEPFTDWKTTEADYARIKEETLEADAIAEELPHEDIGIRPLLALAVKQCATDAEAEEVVRLFYETIEESASK